jgi:hypothetical protein
VTENDGLRYPTPGYLYQFQNTALTELAVCMYLIFKVLTLHQPLFGALASVWRIYPSQDYATTFRWQQSRNWCGMWRWKLARFVKH